MVKKLNLTYYNNLKLDVYLPENKNFTTMVYFHGGGLEVGEKDSPTLVEIAEQFVNEGYGFVSVEYSLYPKTKFPSFLVDGAKAVSYVNKNLTKWGGEKIVLSGQSAGAWICLMLCLNTSYLLNEGVEPTRISGWIIDSAQTTSHFNVLKYERKEDVLSQRINEFAPLYYVNSKTSFSKMLLIFYSQDMPCRYEQNMLFYKSVLSFNKNADIEYSVLEGEHCSGSSIKDKNGNYPFVLTALDWLNKKI